MIYRGYDIIFNDDVKMFRVYLEGKHIESFHTEELAMNWIDQQHRRIRNG